MAIPRNVARPVVKTYITTSPSPSGNTYHVRVYAPRFSLDKRGTASTIKAAVGRATRGVPRAPAPPRKSLRP